MRACRSPRACGDGRRRRSQGLKAAIDNGKPVAIGLVGARSLPDVGRRNHQAVAFGYNVVAGGVDVLIYDPNTHGVTSVLHWRKGEHAHPGVEPTRPSMARTVRARLRRASASEGGRLRSAGSQASASRSAAAASSRVESSVGRGESSGRTSSGISVQASATASHPRSRRRRSRRRKPGASRR